MPIYLTLFSGEKKSDDSCQRLPDNKTLSEVLTPKMLQRLEDHLGWIREEIHSWLTKEQRKVGLNGTFLYSALTDDWEKKRPLWLRNESVITT